MNHTLIKRSRKTREIKSARTYKKLLVDMYVKDQACIVRSHPDPFIKEVDSKVIEKGKAAEQKLIQAGFLKKDGTLKAKYTNPVQKAVAKWYEANFM